MLGEKALRPADVVEQSDGMCRRPVLRYHPDGKTYHEMRMCCERCWEEVPCYSVPYAPNGFVSPDSGRKLRAGSIEGKAAVEAVAKIVCHLCYKADHLDMFGVFADFPEIVIKAA